ncbi:hypothetical protein F4818DRAFT_436206 [Hypoxylon cercidicola]|nr:hypothetical protein F4818DRAFT_436206 [Hypoxylon cercidicola]
MRIALPVLPGIKVMSEVTTMQFVRRRTNIPVPQVYMYNASSTNQLGYEWILMEHMPGQPFAEVQDSLSDGDWRLEYKFSKGPFRNLRDFLSSFAEATYIELHDPRHRAIAELDYPRTDIELQDFEALANSDNPGKARYAKEYLRIETSKERDNRRAQVVKDKARLEELLDGPFLKHWSGVRDQARDYQSDQTTTLRQYHALATAPVSLTASRYSFKYFSEHQLAIEKLIGIINSHVPSTVLPHDSTVLQHWDINGGNVLVDGSTGQPTALLDWEQIYTVPLTLTGPYYPKVFEFLNDTIPKCGQRPSSSWLPEHCLSSYQAVWDAEQMREASNKRLTELKSPWLVAKENEGSSSGSDEMKQQQQQSLETGLLVRHMHGLVERLCLRFSDVDDLAENIKGDMSVSES